MEHRDRLVRFGIEMVEAALALAGKRVVVVEEGEVADDLVRDLRKIRPSAGGGGMDAGQPGTGPGRHGR